MQPIWIYPLILLLHLTTLAGNGLLAQSKEDVPPARALKGLDIGDVGSAGSTTVNDETGQCTVAGSGADIFGESDQFHYAHMPWSGELLLAELHSHLPPNALLRTGPTCWLVLQYSHQSQRDRSRIAHSRD